MFRAIPLVLCVVYFFASPYHVLFAQPAVEVSESSVVFGEKPNLEPFENLKRNFVRLHDRYGGTPIDYETWKSDYTVSGILQTKHVSSLIAGNTDRASAGFAIIVNSDLYESLNSAINLYALDVAGEGYTVDIHTSSGGTPEAFRAFLQGLHSAGMEGCVLIGDLPIAWYEMYGCFDPPYHEEFACDLFYMDLDGVFEDTDHDGLYDSHTGSVEPDIWLGRLFASTLTMDGSSEIGLLEGYFHRNHVYRCGLAAVPNEALLYSDDDWQSRSNFMDILFTNTFEDHTIIDDPWVTWDTDYEDRLTQPREFIQPWVHSNPLLHSFKNPAEQWGHTENWEIKAVDIAAYFFNLCACSIARYTTTDYMAGWYIFGQGQGLAALGSTKVGAMIYFQDFYPSLAEQKPIGQAFLDWYAAQAASGFYGWEGCLFYGMTIIGDPTLRLQKKSDSRVLRHDTEWGGPSYALPNAYNLDFFNTRFTAVNDCRLSAVLMLVTPWVGPQNCRIYVWESDGVFPAAVIDSIDFEFNEVGVGHWTAIDVSDLALEFTAGQDFHVGLTVTNPDPDEYIAIHSCEQSDTLPARSSMMYNGSWVMFPEINSDGLNFCIRAMVTEDAGPEVEIVTLTIPEATQSIFYDQTLEATGGTPPYSWSLTAGNLPDGITLHAESGVLSGIATSPDTSHFTVQAADNSDPALTDFQHLDLITQICSDTCDVICGDANGDESVNVGDAVYLINYVFKGGDPPVPLCIGDVNGDTSVNVGDAVYLINYIFKFGPAPTEACCS